MSAPVPVIPSNVPARIRPLLLVTATAGLLLLGGLLASHLSAQPRVTASGGPAVIEVPEGWIVSVPADRHAVLGVREIGGSARISISVLPGDDAVAAAASRMAQASQRLMMYSQLSQGEVMASGRAWHSEEYVHVVPGRIPVVFRVRDHYRATDGGVLLVGYGAASGEFDRALEVLEAVLDSLTLGGRAP